MVKMTCTELLGLAATLSATGAGQVLTYGRVVRPVLGITLAPPQAARQLGQDGVLALEVMPGSPAYKAGLHPTYRCKLDAREALKAACTLRVLRADPWLCASTCMRRCSKSGQGLA